MYVATTFYRSELALASEHDYAREHYFRCERLLLDGGVPLCDEHQYRKDYDHDG